MVPMDTKNECSAVVMEMMEDQMIGLNLQDGDNVVSYLCILKILKV